MLLHVDVNYIGFKVTPPDSNEITCRVVLAACTCDLPARAQVMNMVQFMGAHVVYRKVCCLCACMYMCLCIPKGSTVITSNSGRVHAFLYSESLSTAGISSEVKS